MIHVHGETPGGSSISYDIDVSNPPEQKATTTTTKKKQATNTGSAAMSSTGSTASIQNYTNVTDSACPSVFSLPKIPRITETITSKKRKNNPTALDDKNKRFHYNQKIIDGNSFDKYVRQILYNDPEYINSVQIE